MTNEKMYEHICIMLRKYDQETGRNDAEKVIARPEDFSVLDKLPYYAFYSSAAAMLIDTKRGMDVKTTPKTAISAINRIVKGVKPGLERFKGIFYHGEKYIVCDGFRLIRLNEDISSIPHVENDFDVDSVMLGCSAEGETIELPTVGDLKAYIAANTRKVGRRKETKAYFLDSVVYVNPKYLVDMIQALPGCTAYRPKSPVSPIYFTSENGDGVLMPVRPPKKEVAV